MPDELNLKIKTEYTGKRIFALTLASLGLFILWPVWLVLAVIIKLDSEGPAMYWSKRIGKNNRVFLMPKLRTMKEDTPQIATNDFTEAKSYITRVGRILRKSSADEIPQLLSVLAGRMSLVGPRPALFNEETLISLRSERGIDKLKPGITGLAQVSGRDFLTIQQKTELDEQYLKQMSFMLDLKIILRTVLVLLKTNQIKH